MIDYILAGLMLIAGVAFLRYAFGSSSRRLELTRELNSAHVAKAVRSGSRLKR